MAGRVASAQRTIKCSLDDNINIRPDHQCGWTENHHLYLFLVCIHNCAPWTHSAR